MQLSHTIKDSSGHVLYSEPYPTSSGCRFLVELGREFLYTVDGDTVRRVFASGCQIELLDFGREKCLSYPALLNELFC